MCWIEKGWFSCTDIFQTYCTSLVCDIACLLSRIFRVHFCHLVSVHFSAIGIATEKTLSLLAEFQIALVCVWPTWVIIGLPCF